MWGSNKRGMLDIVANGQPAAGADSTVSTPQRTLESVYRKHHAFVHRNVRRLGVPHEAVADVTHDVFMVVARKLSKYDEQGSMRGWLFAITARVVQTRERSRRRHVRKLAAIRHSGSAHSKDERLRLERSDLLRRLLQGLEPEQRTVFILSELEGMSATEIGAQLGVSPNTVYSRQRAARERLQRAVARYRARHQRGAAALVVADLGQLVEAELSMPAAVAPALPSLAAGPTSAVAWTIAGISVAALGTGLVLGLVDRAPPEPTRPVSSAVATRSPGASPSPPSAPEDRPAVDDSVDAAKMPSELHPSPPERRPDPDPAAASQPATPTPAPASGPEATDARPTDPTTPASPPISVGSPDPLVREAILLGQAWEALRRGQLSRARALTSEHAREFPQGAMAPEREAVTTIVACRSGASDASRRARRFLQRHGSSPHADSVRAACE